MLPVDPTGQRLAIGNRQEGFVMSALTKDILTGIGRELSSAYLPIVREPLPSELKDLVVQLVAFEMGRPGSSASLPQDLEPVWTEPVPESSSSVPSLNQWSLSR
jgi:hypothetical protein